MIDYQHIMKQQETVIVTTASVSAQMQEDSTFSALITSVLTRFFHGDWGISADHEDAAANDAALKAWVDHCPDAYDRILAVYDTGLTMEPKVWIIEEADRSVITIFFPSEY